MRLIVLLLTCACLAVPLRAAAAAPSTSLLGMNLNGPADWNSELPFVDVFRLSRAWISQEEGKGWGQGPALELDERGWVKRLGPGCRAETPILTIEGGRFPDGDYVVVWEGDGEVDVWNAREVKERSANRLVFRPRAGEGGCFVRLSRTNPENPVRNIRVWMPGYEGAAPGALFHPAFVERWADFSVYRFMDWMQTNNSKVRTWEDRPRVEDATWTVKGIPVEVMVDLCNRQGVDAWFCMPHLADDRYVREFARLVKARLDPRLKVYVELSNEVWNGQFEQARWAQAEAVRLAIPPAERPWEGRAKHYVRRSAEMFRIWEEEMGGTSRLVRVLAWQAASGRYWLDGLVLSQPEAATADALAIAPYLSMNVPARGRDGAVDAPTVGAWDLDRLFAHLEEKALPECLGWMAEAGEVARKHGKRLIAYEAGQHLVGVAGGENHEPLTRILTAANRDPRMGDLYRRYLDGWRAAGGDTCALFSSVGTWSKWGSWGLAEYWDETPAQQPKLAAVLEWNEKNRR